MVTTTFHVRGMTCGHCVKAVTQEVSAIPGVTDVAVELIEGGESPVTVIASADLDLDTLRAAVDEAGYEFIIP